MAFPAFPQNLEDLLRIKWPLDRSALEVSTLPTCSYMDYITNYDKVFFFRRENLCTSCQCYI